MCDLPMLVDRTSFGVDASKWKSLIANNQIGVRQ
jgi:hypothetical protein